MERESKIAQLLLVILIMAFTAFFIYGMYEHKTSMERFDRDFWELYKSVEMNHIKSSMEWNTRRAEESKYPEGKKYYTDAAEDDRKRINRLQEELSRLRLGE